MKCNTCGKMNCMAHGGRMDEDGEHSMQGWSVRSAHALKDAAKDSPGHKEEMDEHNGMAKREAARRSAHAYKLPKPKLKGLAKGGAVKSDKERMERAESDKGTSDVGHAVRSANRHNDWSKDPRSSGPKIEREIGREKTHEAKERAASKLFAEHDRPAPKLKGLADGGEVGMDGDDMDMDLELNEMVAGELIDALEKKDKKGILEAIKALVMNSGGKQ